MSKVAFKDICVFLPKSKIRAGEGKPQGQYPFFTSSDKQSQFLDEFLYDNESLIIGTGGKPSCNYVNGKFSASTDNFIIYTRPNVLTKYLYYFLRNDNLSILEKGFHGAGLKHIGKEYIKSVLIPLVSLSEQKTIVATLDKINELIDANKRQLELFGELVEARFIEMFGDPSSVNDGHTIDDAVKQLIRGPFGSSLKKEFFIRETPNSYKVYEQKHAIENRDDIGTYYIDEKKFQSLKRFAVQSGDIIMSCSGTIGKTHIIKKEFKLGIINQALLLIRLDSNRCNETFFTKQLNLIVERLSKSGSAIKNVSSVKILSMTNFLLPSIEQQNQYAKFVNEVENIKSNLFNQIGLLNEYLDKKMDEYFNGDSNA
jgi:type I restriction enzyme, S subunit